MQRPAVLVLLVVAVMGLAGCLVEDRPHAVDTPDVPPADPDDEVQVISGTLVVLALTPDLDPVEGARVEADDRSAMTGDDGRARLVLAAGNHTVTVTKDGWRSARIAVTLDIGETVEVAAKLFPGNDAPAAPPNATYTVPYDFIGAFECNLTYLIITGDCLLIVDFIVNETLGLPVSPGDATEDQNAFEFPIDLRWKSVVAEMAWEAPLAPVGEKMQLALEPSEAPEDGHAAKYARVTGLSLLSITLEAGVPHPTASASADGETVDMANPAGGEVLMVRAQMLGELHNPGGTEFLGVGAAYGHEFHIYVTVFYGEPAPEGYSRIPA